MEDVKTMLVTTIADTLEINHYLEEVLVQTKDPFVVILLTEQIRKNNETMTEMTSIYLDCVEESKNSEWTTFVPERM
jgi:hypothetical protein